MCRAGLMGLIKDELIESYHLTQPEHLNDEYQQTIFRKILLKQGEYHGNTRNRKSIFTKRY